MFLHFEKWQACHNDFIVVWLDPSQKNLVKSLELNAKNLCSKKGDGIGADGILVMLRSEHSAKTADELIIINADGSRARNCGNGLRCVAMSTLKQHKDAGVEFDYYEGLDLKVQDMSFLCRWSNDLVVVEMPIPLCENEWDKSKDLRNIIQQSITSSDFGLCAIGNPHLVFFNADLNKKSELFEQAKSLQDNKIVDGINVHFTCPVESNAQMQSLAKKNLGTQIEESYEVLVWERGVGPTPACGSGACAILALAVDRSEVSFQQWLGIQMPGGNLFVRWDDASSPVLLAGEAKLVFTGDFLI